MTRLEAIREMTDEELVVFLCSISECETCVAKDTCSYGHKGFTDWVQEEYE